jgi:hypothetical protein
MRIVMLCLLAFLLMGFVAFAEEAKPEQASGTAAVAAAPEAQDEAQAEEAGLDEEEVDPLDGATDIESLKNIIRDQKAEIQDMYSRLSALEAILGDTKKTQDASWTQKVKVTGDLRYRYESIDEQGKPKRQRDRIRTRLGIDAAVTPQLSLGFRLATGSPDPVSTNQSLTDSFSRKSVGLDLAYFDYHDVVGTYHLVGGKMKNPFFTPAAGKGQLIWDGDLTPEGVALQLNGTKGTVRPFLNVANFWTIERSDKPDTKMLGAQAGVKGTFTKGSYTIGGSYYDYSNIAGMATLVDPKKGFGNSVTKDADDNTFYVNDYKLLEAFAEITFKGPGIKKPISFYGDWVKNQDAVGNDGGWQIGASYGETKVAHDWQLAWDYKKVEKDAVLGALSDSDFVGGGTDGKGHRFGFTYQITDAASAALTYFMNDKGLGGPKDYRRLQLDFNFKF